MVRVRCPACRCKAVEGAVCKRCGHDLTGPAPDISGASLGSRFRARLYCRPVDTSYRANMPWRPTWLVGTMSALVIGSGHIYCKSYRLGVTYLGLAVFLTWAITNISLWALFILAVLWQYQIFKACEVAEDFNWNAILRAEELESKQDRA